MPSLNLDLNFFDHPKVKRIRAAIGPEAEIYLIRLWAYTGRFHPDDGVLKGYTEQEIEGLAEWKGDRGIMLQAMLRVGFIEKVGSHYQIHDWSEHEGHLMVYRARARVANTARWKKHSLVKNASSNAKDDIKESPISSVQFITKQSKALHNISVNAEGCKPINWENCKSDLQRLMAYYISVEMPEVYAIGKQSQVQALFKRFGKAASELLTVAGNLSTAKRIFDLSAAHYNKKGLSWNLSTVAANAGEFLNIALQENKHGT